MCDEVGVVCRNVGFVFFFFPELPLQSPKMTQEPEKKELKRRVKVFSFGDSNYWEDMGTGFISKDYIEVTRGEVLTITVRSEVDNSIIIKSKVLPDRSYRIQEVGLSCAPGPGQLVDACGVSHVGYHDSVDGE